MRRALMMIFAGLTFSSAVALADNTCGTPKSCADWSDWYAHPRCLSPMMCPIPVDGPEERFRMCWVRNPLLAQNGGQVSASECVETETRPLPAPQP